MAARKIFRKKTSSAPPNLLSILLHPNTVTVAALVLAAAGVFLLHKGNTALGFILLALAPALLAVVLLGGLPSFPKAAGRKSVPAPKAVKTRPSSPGRAGSFSLKGTGLTPLAWAGLALVLAGFILGGFCQMAVVNSPQVPGWGLWGLYFLAGLLLTAGLFLMGKKSAAEPAPLPPKVECYAFGAIMVLAAFFRVFRLGSMPSGMFIDQGMEGWAALRILHEHSYWPVWEFDVWQNPALLLYQLAGWFLCLTPFHCIPSQFGFYLFYALLSLATFPLVYWTFRQIGGQRLALLGLFILAVMRWNVNFSRNGFPTIEVPFYMFGTLAFLTYALRPTKEKFFRSAAIASGVFFLLGCLPFLVLAYKSVWEGKHLWAVALAVLLLLAAVAGAVFFWKANKNRESYLSAVIAGGFFAMGLYTYQAYKIVPLLILLFAAYEMIAHWKLVRDSWKSLLGFSIVFLVLAYPFIQRTYDIRQQLGGSREGDLLIFSRMHEQHSSQPLIYNLWRTAVMFNWHGDAMSRHNIQDYRMLDDVTGALFILGIVGALVFLRKKPWFYGLVGLLVMTVPCVLSIDAAHANRMLGTTPFIALLAALPLSALWGRLRNLLGEKGNLLFPALAVLPLLFMALQNYDAYFRIMARSISSWSEYSARETAIGKAVARLGDDYEDYISPVYYNYYTINYFGYFHQERLHPLALPDSLISRTPTASRGLYYAIEQGRTGVLDLLEKLYPGGTPSTLVDPAGNTAESFFTVPPAELAKVRGLAAHFDTPVDGSVEKQMTAFPAGLPKGPYHAALTGNLYVPATGDYKWEFKGDAQAAMKVRDQRANAAGYYHLEKGEHPVEVDLTVEGTGVPQLTLQQTPQSGIPGMLDAGSFDSLPAPRGLLGRYYRDTEGKSAPFLEEWDPVVNFTNGNDFSAQGFSSIRWSGSLMVEEAGDYRLSSYPANAAQIKVDGKEWPFRGGSLKKGPHSIEVFVRAPGGLGNLSLMWLKPNGMTEVVPNSAFGEVK